MLAVEERVSPMIQDSYSAIVNTHIWTANISELDNSRGSSSLRSGKQHSTYRHPSEHKLGGASVYAQGVPIPYTFYTLNNHTLSLHGRHIYNSLNNKSTTSTTIAQLLQHQQQQQEGHVVTQPRARERQQEHYSISTMVYILYISFFSFVA